MTTLVNPMAGTLLAITIAYYVFVYTIWLKRRTPQNIVIGGAAGAFPPMIGWAAVTGGIDGGSLSLFLIIFLWTPPHFWALALYRSDDYARVNVPMLLVVAGKPETKRQMLLNTLLLVPVSFLPALLGISTAFCGAVAVGLGAVFMQHGLNVHKTTQNQPQARCLCFPYNTCFDLPNPSRRQGNCTNSVNPHADLESRSPKLNRVVSLFSHPHQVKIIRQLAGQMRRTKWISS